MPTIFVWGLPKSVKKRTEKLRQTIKETVRGIGGLGLKDNNAISVFFPPDIAPPSIGKDIVIRVSDLFTKAERTLAVRKQLAEGLGIAVLQFFPEAEIECSVHPFSAKKKGYWKSTMRPRKSNGMKLPKPHTGDKRMKNKSFNLKK